MREVGGERLSEITVRIVDKRYLVVNAYMILVVFRRVQRQGRRLGVGSPGTIASQTVCHVACRLTRQAPFHPSCRDSVNRLAEVAEVQLGVCSV